MINFIKALAPFLGILYFIFILVFLILSIPVYLYRVAIIYLAKYSRPDLGDILGGQSAIFVGDYLAKTPPRANVVCAMIFEGQLKIEEIQARVMKNWIQVNDKSGLENFQRYPVKWLGFTFWKDASNTFSIQKHVKVCKHSEGGKQITDKQLTEIMESLVNEKIPQFQSPWTLQLIENYQHPSVQPGSTEERKQHSALIFQWHHCLVDGVGATTALLEALCEQRWLRKAETPLPKTKGWRKILRALTIPLRIFAKLSWFSSHSFLQNTFKVPDARKHWYQVCVSSGPIPVENIKNIKNAFKVSYASVLLSALSVAVHRTLVDQAEKVQSILCTNTLPARSLTKRKILANHMSSAMFELPCDKFANPVERLNTVHQRLQRAKESVIPIMVPIISTLIGSHTQGVNSRLMDNKMVAVGLTNFAGVPKNIELDKNTSLVHVHTKLTGGLFAGVQGANIASISHGGQMEIFLCAERALMSTEEAEKFVDHIKEDIENLRVLMSETTCFDEV